MFESIWSAMSGSLCCFSFIAVILPQGSKISALQRTVIMLAYTYYFDSIRFRPLHTNLDNLESAYIYIYFLFFFFVFT